MTVGTLLGIKSVGRDAEHVIALDADAVDDRTYNSAGLERLAGRHRTRSVGFF